MPDINSEGGALMPQFTETAQAGAASIGGIRKESP